MQARTFITIAGLSAFLVLHFSTVNSIAAPKLSKGLYAVIETSMGTITCRLFEKQTPKTVANFVGLAEGTKEWTDTKTGKKVKKKLYDGLIFHRVIPDFMIQGGDPLGTGAGGPGYQFEDEIVSSLVFDKPGKLAMANAGPGTNGSQFFITTVPTPWLNGHHTIFGEVVSGQDVAVKISNVKCKEVVSKETGETINLNKPLTPVVIKKIVIKRVK